MRVLHFMKSFSPLTETFIYDIITELERQGERGHVFALERENSRKRPFPRVETLPIPPKWDPRRLWHGVLAGIQSPLDSGSYAWPGYRTRIRKSVERFEPDIIHAHFGIAGLIVAPVAETSGVPLMVSFYGYDISRKPREAAVRKEYRTLWNTAAAVIVLSREMRRQAIALGCPASKLHVIHLGRNLDLAPTQTRRPVQSFLSVGRLTEKKGHLDTIKAVQRVRATVPSIELRIIGDGHLKGELASYIESNGLSECIKLLGALPSQEVLRQLKSVDAFILASRTADNGDREGTPTVLIEAQMLGLPCISTWHAGIPEMIPAENHWLLADEGDVAAITDRIRRLRRCSQDELASIAATGRAKIETDFNLNTEVNKLRKIYTDVTSHDGGERG